MSELKTNKLSDLGGNELLTSNGSGVISTGGLITNTPAFWVAKNATQTIAGDQNVQLTYEEELLDSAGAFASSTFTPQSSGSVSYTHLTLPTKRIV